jgi:putative PIN family toxin of toxin-antitoxin system
VATTIRPCQDPKDDKFLELAVDGQVDWIITGDKDLCSCRRFNQFQF